jgi:hypothetical protein
MAGKGQSKDETERNDQLAHQYQDYKDYIPIVFRDGKVHYLEHIHRQQTDRACKSDEKDNARRGVTNLLLHEVLGHDRVTEPGKE